MGKTRWWRPSQVKKSFKKSIGSAGLYAWSANGAKNIVLLLA